MLNDQTYSEKTRPVSGCNAIERDDEMISYINDDGLSTIERPRIEIITRTVDIDAIVARTEPPKQYQKLVLNLTLSAGVLTAFEFYIARMMVADGWRNGDSDLVEVKDIWATTHTVRYVEPDGILCIGGCDGKGRKFVADLRCKGWLDSFLSCYVDLNQDELRSLFSPEAPPTKYRVWDWWESNKAKVKVKVKQNLVVLSEAKPFAMSEESLRWWLQNRVRWLLCLFLLSVLILAALASAIGLAFGMIPLPERADRAIIVGLLLALLGFVWHWFWLPIWRKIAAETPIGWSNGTLSHNDEKYREKRLAFYKSQGLLQWENTP